MAGFDAAAVVEPLDWDFSKYGAGKGTIPEPSDVEIERFLRKWRVLVTGVIQQAEAKDEAKAEAEKESPTQLLTMDQTLEAMRQIDITDGELVAPEIAEAMLDLVVTITKTSPTREQIAALPNRVRGAFYGWLIGQMTDPDFYLAADSKPSLALVKGG